MAGSTGQAEHVVGDDPATDRGLVDSVLAGDAASFRGLVDRHQTRIVAFLHRLCGCPEQALDLAQETFL